MNILSININGFGKGDYKVPLIRKLVDKHNIDFMGIQETKRKNISDMSLKQLWGSHDFDATCSNTLGQGGRLVSIWNKNCFHKQQAIVRKDCIIIIGTRLETRGTTLHH